ncbi:MAG: hypothetical protein ACRDMH_00190 [Solirubrobacterales bacterium]
MGVVATGWTADLAPRAEAHAGSRIVAATGDRTGVHTWYVHATSRAGGEGSRQQPFDSLAAAQTASGRGDTIVILRAREGATLEGGIALKRGQTLVGAGPSIRARPASASVPQITNTEPTRHSGDAVVLANRTTVSNLAIAGSYRSGIYGDNVKGVDVHGNEVSAHNTSCAVGFIVLPFTVPTNVPGGSITVANGFSNGRAGIMLDESHGRGRVEISRNFVHDAECGDGIDLRLTGSARIRADIDRNVLADLKQGPQFASLLAIGTQTRGHSRLAADIDHNRQRNLGSPKANSEGVFANLNGRSQLQARVNHNTYTNVHGVGGFSSNGMEMITSSGSPRARMVLRNSSFSGSPGDILVEGNLGTNSRTSLTLNHVVATRSTGTGDTGFIPFNNGDCLVTGIGGDKDSLSLRIRDSRLTHCMNNGITFAGGLFAGGTMHLAINRSRVTDNRGGNLFFRNFGALHSLSAKIQHSDLSGSQGDGSGVANVEFDQQGTSPATSLDLGGGRLGSMGHNCIADGSLDLQLRNVHLAAEHDWWGAPSGPAPAKTVLQGSATLGFAPPLTAKPSGC